MKRWTGKRFLVAGLRSVVVIAGVAVLLFGAGRLEAQEEIGVKPGKAPRDSDQFVPGELIVKSKPAVSPRTGQPR